MRAASTIIIARILGPLLLIIGLALVVRPSILAGIVDAFAADSSTPLIWGIFALTFGLTILAFHWRWRGVLEIVITVIGCASVVRGVVLLFVPMEAIGVARTVLSAAPVAVIVIGALTALLGAWLSFEGFRAKTS